MSGGLMVGRGSLREAVKEAADNAGALGTAVAISAAAALLIAAAALALAAYALVRSR